ncbi:MAG: hypothetical protein J3K34DRAFT_416609 [Monoraphidium minutum]|nr:MAG: hypothetical protein J3K34DRAFT_416609 [Monoraphidium minutum]
MRVRDPAPVGAVCLACECARPRAPHKAACRVCCREERRHPCVSSVLPTEPPNPARSVHPPVSVSYRGSRAGRPAAPPVFGCPHSVPSAHCFPEGRAPEIPHSIIYSVWRCEHFSPRPSERRARLYLKAWLHCFPCAAASKHARFCTKPNRCHGARGGPAGLAGPPGPATPRRTSA